MYKLRVIMARVRYLKQLFSESEFLIIYGQNLDIMIIVQGRDEISKKSYLYAKLWAGFPFICKYAHNMRNLSGIL